MSWNLRLLTPILLLAVACTPKGDEEDDGSETAAEDSTVGASSTSGEVVTTGDSDPTTPGTATNNTGIDSTTTTSPGTTATATATGNDEATSNTTVPGTSVDPSDTDDSETATDTATATTGPVEPPPACEGDAMDIVANTIFAYTESQVPPPDPTTNNTSTTGGEPNPPNTIYVKFSDQVYTCEDPNALLACGPHWEMTIVIKPEFQFPGVYDLLNTDQVFGFAMETGTPEGMGECSFGGGSFGATFELIKITDTTVEGRLCNVEGLFFETDPQLEGNFVAERCQ
jgi:hypothetical protein